MRLLFIGALGALATAVAPARADDPHCADGRGVGGVGQDVAGYDACVRLAAQKDEASGETPDAIASAAIVQCSRLGARIRAEANACDLAGASDKLRETVADIESFGRDEAVRVIQQMRAPRNRP